MKKEKIERGRYYNEPKFERYSKAVKAEKNRDIRKALYKEQESLEKKYAKQQAQIALGSKQSQSQYNIENLRNKLYKLGQKRMVSRKILKQDHPTLVIPAYKHIPYKSSYFNGTRGAE